MTAWDRLQGHGEQILLIEDDAHVREFGKKILNKNGYLVDDVEDASQAPKILTQKTGGYNLIISDVVLPDLNGVELVTRLHQINTYVPVIMSSGYTEEKSWRNRIKENHYAFLQKPFDVESMRRTVKETLVDSRT